MKSNNLLKLLEEIFLYITDFFFTITFTDFFHFLRYSGELKSVTMLNHMPRNTCLGYSLC